MKTHRSHTRLIIIFFVFALLYLLVLINLYVVQIWRSRFFQQLAQQQYSMMQVNKPLRAEIFDRTGKPIALNKESITAFIIPSRLEEPARVTAFLEKHFKPAAERLKKNKKSHFLYIKRRLSQNEIDRIQASSLTDIKLLREPSRYYPIAGLGPLVGITNIDNEGLFGVELLCNEQLAGKPTTYLLEKDCRSKHYYFKKETKVSGIQGKPISLTIDSLLQFLVYEELKEYVHYMGSKEGAVLIMNPENGHIHVMANYPDFNANAPEQLDPKLTKNHLITDAYELGSVMKGFAALAALEHNVITPKELVDCENKKSTKLLGIPISTTKANGIVPFEDVIKFSNNIGIAKVIQRVGEPLYDYYRRLGFGKKINIFPGENAGFINPPATWSKASLISLSFGYEISANLVQLAQALAIIANNGFMVKPRLILSDDPVLKEGPLFSQKALDQIREILKKTIDEGAAQKAHIDGYNILGKTGTARLITNGKYDKTRHIFTFMTIVEKDEYKRVVVIFIKETSKKGLLASAVAAPLFEKIAHKMLIHDKVI